MGVSGTATASNLIMQTSYQKAPAQPPMMNKMLMEVSLIRCFLITIID